MVEFQSRNEGNSYGEYLLSKVGTYVHFATEYYVYSQHLRMHFTNIFSFYCICILLYFTLAFLFTKVAF